MEFMQGTVAEKAAFALTHQMFIPTFELERVLNGTHPIKLDEIEILLVNNKPVGVMVAARYWVMAFIVEGERRKGYGRALYAQLTKDADAEDLESYYGEGWNKPSRMFWKKLGILPTD